MAVSYNRLWKLLIDKNMGKCQLRQAAALAPNTLTKMRKEELVSMSVDEMVALGIAKHSPSSDEVQTLAAKVHDFYKTAFSETMLSPAELMKSFIETFRDPSAEPVFDKVLQARGASRYIAKALSHYYNNHLEELQTITKTMED